MSEETRAVVATSAGHAPTRGTVTVHEWTRAEARHKALRWMFSVWALGLATLPIPGVHFIAPPACLIAGPLVAYLIFRMHAQATEIRSSTLACPACGQELGIRAFVAQWPHRLPCPHCQAWSDVALDKA